MLIYNMSHAVRVADVLRVREHDLGTVVTISIIIVITTVTITK